jgi:signal transduction histidine kinase
MLPQFSSESRGESLIAGARLLTAAALLLALGLAGRHGGIVLPLAAYLLYSLVLALLLRFETLPLRARAAVHGLDLATLALLSWRSAADPLVSAPLFAFLLFSAVLRWRWHGVLWTALGGLAAGLGWEASLAARGAIQLEDLLAHGGTLALLALLLAAVSACQQRLGREMSRIAAWPHAPLDGNALPAHLLEHARAILQAPRLLLAWEELDEPWLHLAHWSGEPGGEVEITREIPPAYQPLVPEPLADVSFLATHAGDAAGSTLATLSAGAAGVPGWSGAPVHPDLRQRFAIDRVASWPLKGEAVAGRLFALGHWHLDREYLVLGEVVARRIVSELDRFYLTQPLRSKAVAEERVRVACDLHDGPLQSLAGTGLQLEVLARQLGGAPDEAREQLREIQRAIAADQRELRFFIEELKPASRRSETDEADLAARLEELAEWLRCRCGLAVELDLHEVREGISQGLTRQLYRLVREALFNVARHSGAASARVEVRRQGRGLEVNVTDDGRGFPFSGRFDHEELNRRKLGPVSLKERISALGGSLAIDTGPGRTRLQMRLPAVGDAR